jgi:RHS repeat-associated protein
VTVGTPGYIYDGPCTADQRYYAVGTGRFNSPDPSTGVNAGDPGSWNRYAYVQGDPVNFNDSEGLEGWPLDCITNGMAYPPMVCQALGRPSGIRGPLLIDPLPLTPQQSWLLASGLKAKVAASGGRYTDCDALADFAGIAADRSQNDRQFMSDFGALVPEQAASSVLRYYSKVAVLLWSAGPSGFAKAFQNSTDDSPKGNSDQGHHFAAFFEFGYQYGGDIGGVATNIFELTESFIASMKGQGFNLNSGDMVLGMVAAQIGSDLRSGKITRDQVSSEIRRLCNH